MALGVKVDAGFGRLYVTGPRSRAVMSLPGGTLNIRRNAVELSLTLETLRAVKEKLACTSGELAAACTEPVMQWAKAAQRSEKVVKEMHDRLATGWRASLPWLDTRAGSPAPPGADPKWVDESGLWKYQPPFAHQEVMASVAISIDGCAYRCDMGTGKTRAALEAMSERVRRGEISYAVIVCPQRVMATWQRETPRWTRNLHTVLLTGSVRARLEILRRLSEAPPPPEGEGVLLVVNYEVLHKMFAGFGALMEKHASLMLLDECHKVKNPQAKVTKAALEMTRHANARLIMSGTLHTGKDTDVWSQWYVVDLGITFGANYSQFKREFFVENTYTFELTPKKNTAELLGQRMARRGLIYKKADCLDLPPKLYQRVDVEMTREQRKAYEEMAEELITKLNEEVYATASTQLVAMMRLAQITSGFVKDEFGSIHRFTPNPKLEALKELVEETMGEGKSMLVWAWFKPDNAILLETFAHLNPARFQAGQSVEEQGEEERRFQAQETGLGIGQQASGGIGITLTRAEIAAYYSQDHSMVNRMQSEDRCHRAGSEIHPKVTYVDFMCPGSIDEVVRSSHHTKLDAAAAVEVIRAHIQEVLR